jgi:hypothetical protein
MQIHESPALGLAAPTHHLCFPPEGNVRCQTIPASGIVRIELGVLSPSEEGQQPLLATD